MFCFPRVDFLLVYSLVLFARLQTACPAFSRDLGEKKGWLICIITVADVDIRVAGVSGVLLLLLLLLCEQLMVGLMDFMHIWGFEGRPGDVTFDTPILMR
tara:strand:+ start:1066 stop:1365 length:300 start_codon:yes stop_codon:yes gene_type:complete